MATAGRPQRDMPDEGNVNASEERMGKDDNADIQEAAISPTNVDTLGIIKQVKGQGTAAEWH